MYPLKTRFVTADFSDLSVPIHYSSLYGLMADPGLEYPSPFFNFLFSNVKGKIRFFRFLCTNPCTLLLNALATDPGLASPPLFFPIFTV